MPDFMHYSSYRHCVDAALHFMVAWGAKDVEETVNQKFLIFAKQFSRYRQSGAHTLGTSVSIGNML